MDGFIQDKPGAVAAPPASPPRVTAPKPKRPYNKKAPVAAAAPAMQADVAPALDNVPVDRPARRPRKPFGSFAQKLDYPARPNYHRHWFNDVPGRLDQAKEAGYEHVVDERNTGPVKRPVGTNPQGGVLFAYLMEIPEEWYREDMQVEQDRITSQESSISRGVVLDAHGERQDVFRAEAQGRRTSIRHGVR